MLKPGCCSVDDMAWLRWGACSYTSLNSRNFVGLILLEWFRSAGDIMHKLINDEFLLGDNGLNEIADGNDANEFFLLHDG